MLTASTYMANDREISVDELKSLVLEAKTKQKLQL